MNKLIVQLSGGLGNQMFQYACARSLSLQRNFELVLDNWSGFVRDSQYKRNYQLEHLPIQSRLATRTERLPLWYFRLINRVNNSNNNKIINKTIFGNFLTETHLNDKSKVFLPELYDIPKHKYNWLIGYWQSYKYFQNYVNQIRKELSPHPPNLKNFLRLGDIINSVESVAIGLRFYEESSHPNLHALNQKMKNISEIKAVVKKLLETNSKRRFFIFCTHNSKFFDELNLPKNTVYVTPENGFENSIGTLWLLTLCDYHIFNNSSFYWWGAWLSKKWHKEKKIYIFAADNFINRDSLCKEWSSF